MASSYSNPLRLEEIGVGEASGTWGTKTNTTISNLATALASKSKNIGSDANATFTMPDGTADDIRAFHLKITSATLTATRTVTIAPNTVNKVWIIDNATTGSQSIVISQGSGANITIPSGQCKVVYTDGAGSGAAVIDALADLNLSGTTTIANASITNGTFTGTQVDILSQGDIRLQDSTGGQYVALQAPATVSSNVTLTLPATDGTADQVLSTDGAGVLDWVTSGGAYNAWLIKTGAYTALPGDQLIVNSASAVTITLPASPTAGQTVVLKNRGAGLVTVGRNSSNIESTASDGSLGTGASTQLVYVDGTIGWEQLA
tara:strand:- start:2439 stop:3392 length:954 start_codon:yes stop_codon:yes gene_type:complete